MKAVILAGGLGTRISEESIARPKPMIEIGGMPVLWHILKIYSFHGINDFIICCGYKGYMIKEYFANYFLHCSNVTFDLRQNEMKIHDHIAEPWTITLVDTGQNTATGGRLKRVAQYIGCDEVFCFTYGDGVGDINIENLINFHKNHGKLATLTSVNPPGRFGALEISKDKLVNSFKEKPKGDGGMINGGFFVLNRGVLDLIDGDDVAWEGFPLESLASQKQLMAYSHDGFWQPMDTLRDKVNLEKLWESNNAPWKLWE